LGRVFDTTLRKIRRVLAFSGGHRYFDEVINFLDYIRDLAAEWLVWMSAGPFLVDRLFSWFRIGETWWPDFRRNIAIYIIVGGVFGAGFLVWQDEHRRRVALETGRAVPIATVEGGSSYDVAADDFVVAVLTVSGAPTKVNLPVNPMRGQRLEIKDAAGNASTGGIVVNGNGRDIDNEHQVIIGNSYAAITITYTGIRWIRT